MERTLKENVHQNASAYLDDIVKLRREIHANPELSWEEKNTSRRISELLSDYGIEHRNGVAGNGIVAFIRGAKAGGNAERVIALRGDMDALPIQETNEVPYKSQVPGVMHACGHDVHASSLLGSARILNELKSEFSGTVKLIFQPSEERLPSGALEMIKAGVLKDPQPEVIFGQHVHPPVPMGKLGFHAGQYMASADEVYITIKGKGGHAGTPHVTIDPVVIAAHLIVALQQIVSRKRDPFLPAVLSFGKITAGGATNVIPDEGQPAGALRAMDEQWRMETHERIKEMTVELAGSMGADWDITIHKGIPSLFNDEATTQRARGFAEEYLGRENVIDTEMRMTAEDFAFYTQHMPACFYRLGVSNAAKGITSPIHTSTFDIDEAALEIGMGFMAYLAIRTLEAAT